MTRCAHSSCYCSVASPGESCGDLCRESAAKEPASESEADLACACGHADCYRQLDSALIGEIEEDLES